MQRLGLQDSLSRPFSGTLLLPTNDAIDEYMAQVELLHQRDGTFADPDTEQRMWSNLLEYHQLRGATSTRQRGMAVTLSTVHLDQGAASQAGWTQASATKTIHTPGPGSNSPFHKLIFMCNGAARAAAATPTTDPQTFRWRCEVTSIRDEQGNSVTFASKNTAVLGGGLIHSVNSVLQPNDVYPSLAALLANDPELSIWAAIIKAVANQTACWEGPWWLRSPDCCFCNQGYYQGQGETCLDGCFYNVTNPDPFPECPLGSNYTCVNGTLPVSYVYFPFGYSAPLEYSAMVAADEDVTAAANIKENKARCRQFQTCGLEGINGTFSLPTDGGFKEEDWGPANSDGVPININAAFWKPIVQFHFIRANSQYDFVDYNETRGGFPARSKRTNLLGSLKKDDTDSYKLAFEAAQSKLSVKYRSPRGPAETSITQPTIHIPRTLRTR